MSGNLRILFAGTSKISVDYLCSLLNSQHEIVGVLTKSDKKVGRGQKIKPNLVKLLSRKHNLPIFQVSSHIQEEQVQAISNLDIDIVVVVSFGMILPKELLELPQLGCVNVHYSLLPRWRGAAPIQRALLAGDEDIGLSIFKINDNLDEGDILYQRSYKVEPSDTTNSLYEKFFKVGIKALCSLFRDLSIGMAVYRSQDSSQATFAKKINKEEARLDWNLPALQLDRCVRAFNPWPISYFFMPDHTLVKVWKTTYSMDQICRNMKPGQIFSIDPQGIHVVTGRGILTLVLLQIAGRKKILAKDLASTNKTWIRPGINLNTYEN